MIPRGSLCSSLDGTAAVNFAYFESRAKHDTWENGDLFRNHVPRVAMFLEGVEPAL